MKSVRTDGMAVMGHALGAIRVSLDTLLGTSRARSHPRGQTVIDRSKAWGTLGGVRPATGPRDDRET